MNLGHIDNYLKRLDIPKEAIALDKNSLFLIQKQHLLQIPFENLDIHLKVPIVLDIESIFEKIIGRNRGGFCYELNGLCHAFLSQLGFNAVLISCRVYNEDSQTFSPEFDHMAILVTVENEKYIFDVGFGDFSRTPILFRTEPVITNGYGIKEHTAGYFLLFEVKDGGEVPSYIFKTEPKLLPDFEARCNWHQQSSESHFSKKRMISMATPNRGRITLTDTHIIRTQDQSVEKEGIHAEDFYKKLKEHFKIDLESSKEK